MASYLGVDWAGGCWVVVKTGDSTSITTEPSILNVWHRHGEDVRSILVDIPIGLPDSGGRACDVEARKRLAGRGSTVFPVPAREVVEAETYERAKELNEGSLGSQSWWLFPRIREVDVFLQIYRDARDEVYESHPEICFAELTGSSLEPKTSEEGRRERLIALAESSVLHDEVTDVVHAREDGTAWHDRISKRRLDDVIDAAVLAHTAGRLGLGLRSEDAAYPALPSGTVETDDVLEIPMEMVHPGE